MKMFISETLIKLDMIYHTRASAGEGFLKLGLHFKFVNI